MKQHRTPGKCGSQANAASKLNVGPEDSNVALPQTQRHTEGCACGVVGVRRTIRSEIAVRTSSGGRNSSDSSM